MKIKLDENIPAAVLSDLSEMGHDALSVYQQGLKGTADSLLPVYINGDGETTRDFCFIENCVQANLLAGTTQNTDAYETH